MKKILYPVLALGAIATLASCASDEPINVKEYDGTARFSGGDVPGGYFSEKVGVR